MKKEIFDAYRKDGWHLFKLIKVGEGGNAVKGMYKTPKGWNQTSEVAYNKNAVYGGVPPKSIVAIDWDVKNGKVGDKSFEQLQKDLGVTLETTVTSPSGGGHAYMYLPSMPDDKPKLKKAQERYPDIDFQSWQSEFVVLGGQVVEGYGEYAFTDEDFEYFVNNAPEKLPKTLELRSERVEGEGYENVDWMVHASTRPSIDEIQLMLTKLDPNMGHDDGWQQVIMSLNAWDLNGEVGLKLATEWSMKSDAYLTRADDEGYDLEQSIRDKYYACVADSSEHYNKLFTIANNADKKSFDGTIKEATTVEQLEAVAKDIQVARIKSTDREEYINKLEKKCKDITGKGQRVKWKGAVKFISTEKAEAPEGVKLYLNSGKFIIQNNEVIVEDIGTQMVGKYLKTFGYSKEQQEGIQDNITLVENLKYVPDYLINSEVDFFVEENGGTQLPSLVVRSNPLIDVGDYIHDDEILNDFLEDIWCGKAEDIVRLLALTIKMGEQKLNRLMVVAPSNTGKSEIFSMMNFQKITMPRLLNGLRGDKGIGSAVIDGIRKSALLLIDETNKPLEAEIKDMDKELHVDQFGSGGTQILPLHFTALTSTHTTATRNNSDELYNRFLQVELNPKDVKHTLMQSEVFLRDSDRYTLVVKSYLLSLFRSTILSEEGKSELRELQDKYRLPTNTDLDELLFEISEDFISQTKSTATSRGDVVLKGNEYFYKRKGDVVGFFEARLGEIGSLDVGKYAELLSKHFLSLTGKTIKIDGKPTKYYKVSMTAYANNDSIEIDSMFDDLDIDEL